VAAAHERAVGACYPLLSEVALQGAQSPDRVRRQRPGFHFAIRRRGEVREPGARHLTQRRARRGEADFAGRHERRNRVAELGEPAAGVHPVFGAGPAAELLSVVHEHGERTARAPQLAQVGADLGRRPEGDEIAEPLVDRK